MARAKDRYWEKPHEIEEGDGRLSEYEESHGSYGMASFSRITHGGEAVLFGSSIKHHETIELTLCTAKRSRHLNRWWYYHTGEIIQVAMSQSQFVELITTMNRGQGVPVTIKTVGLEPAEDPPFVDDRRVVEQEFRDRIAETGKSTEQIGQLHELLSGKGGLSATEKKQAASLLRHIVSDLRGSLPFIQTSFNEAVDKTVQAAKSEVDAFVERKISSLGLQTLRQLAELEDNRDRHKLQIEGGISEPDP
jgi:hypothetical protein